MRAVICAAYLDTRQDYSVDRVVADPGINKKFLDRCRGLGLDLPPKLINQALLNLRKSGNLKGIKSKRTSFNNEDEYRYASEMAIRFIERRDGVSLDAVISDPQLAVEFDGLASELSPGFSPLQYRWAALNLRKKKNLSPELVPKIVRAASTNRYKISDVVVSDIPKSQGIYFFIDSQERVTLYIGESVNLQKRVGKHLEHSDNKGLARWLWEKGIDDLWLDIQVLPDATPTAHRRSLEAELIKNHQPVFNTQRL